MLFFLLKAWQDLSLFKFKFAHSKNRDCAKIKEFNVPIKAVFFTRLYLQLRSKV